MYHLSLHRNRTPTRAFLPTFAHQASAVVLSRPDIKEDYSTDSEAEYTSEGATAESDSTAGDNQAHVAKQACRSKRSSSRRGDGNSRRGNSMRGSRPNSRTGNRLSSRPDSRQAPVPRLLALQQNDNSQAVQNRWRCSVDAPASDEAISDDDVVQDVPPRCAPSPKALNPRLHLLRGGREEASDSGRSSGEICSSAIAAFQSRLTSTLV